MGSHWVLRWLAMLVIFALSTMAFSYASAAWDVDSPDVASEHVTSDPEEDYALP